MRWEEFFARRRKESLMAIKSDGGLVGGHHHYGTGGGCSEVLFLKLHACIRSAGWDGTHDDEKIRSHRAEGVRAASVWAVGGSPGFVREGSLFVFTTRQWRSKFARLGWDGLSFGGWMVHLLVSP